MICNQKVLRSLMLAVFVLAGSFSQGCNGESASKRGSLVVVSYGGGAWQKSHEEAFFRPFQLISGDEVISVVWNAEYGKLKNDVASGDVDWTVVEVTAAQFIRGKKDGLFETLNLSLSGDDFVEGALDPYGVANVFWATVLAYDGTKFLDRRPPDSWKDFWNFELYPGSRALYDDPRGNLEFALLADGVRRENLYPLDVDRAFASLDRLKPHIRVWWEDGSQPAQLLAADQVVMSSAWNGRLFAARSNIEDLNWSWRGAAHDLDYWVIPKGAKNKTIGERFIWYASQPYSLGLQAQLVGYGPANLVSLKYIPDDIKSMLPTEPNNFQQGFVVDSEWWAENESEVQRRWIMWKAK